MSNVFLMQSQPHLSLDTDAITSIDDVKAVLKALDIGFSKGHADHSGILHLCKEKGASDAHQVRTSPERSNNVDSCRVPQNSPHDGVPCQPKEQSK